MKPKRRLFWRLYIYGLLLLFAVSLSTALAVHSLTDISPIEGIHKRIAESLARDLAQPENLQKRLDELRFLLDVDLAIFNRQGHPVASSGSGLDHPLDADQMGRLGRQVFFHGPEGFRLALALPGTEAYLLSAVRTREGPRRLLVALLTILLVLGLTAWPLARSLARPIEQLTRTASALAKGELDQRSHLKRKDEIGILAKTMDEMAARLQARIRAERELLSNVSHELRTPMARMRVALELGLEPEADLTQARSQLKGMAGDLDELVLLLEEVFAIGKLELADDGSGRMPLTLSSLQLDDYMNEIATAFAKRHPERKLDLHLQAELPPLDADGALLRRAIDNLLDNAVRHAQAPEDAVIELSAQRSADGHMLELDVADCGKGIPTQDRARLFEPFYQADASRSTAGRGLGLTLCKRIAESHGGDVILMDGKSQGNVFRISLPFTSKKA
ncbi:MAG: HAMP domain-containing histidine kinase [Deltaproteobacteria bacterium]|nr:HAMP domain-containing histidine kinase [Deltaproteobacteria bacterium]